VSSRPEQPARPPDAPAPVVLYRPRGRSRSLPLSLVHVGSALRGRRVVVVDGQLDLAPEARVVELARDALCLGLSVPTGEAILDALGISRAAKSVRPDLPVIWGGWHASQAPDLCLASGVVDACVVGPGEGAIAEIVKALDAGLLLGAVRGVTWRCGGEVVRNPARPAEPAGAFPRADFGLLELERYFRWRGARRIDYCSSRNAAPARRPAEAPDAGPAWTALPAPRVVAEVLELVERHQVSELCFVDADFFVDEGRAAAVASGFLDQRVRVEWRASGGWERLARRSDEHLKLLRAAGCRRIDLHLALEPPTAGGALEPLIEFGRRLHGLGIGACFSFLAGIPGEATARLSEIYRAARKLRGIDARFDTLIALFAPYPGSEVGEGRFTARRVEDWSRVDPAHALGPWTPAAARRWVPRYNFYLRHGYEKPERGVGRHLLHWIARARNWTGFYRLDLERRGVELVRRWRAGLGSPLPTPIEE